MDDQSIEWHEIGHNRRGEVTRIRKWNAGDGLICSESNVGGSRRRIHCGAPVAVLSHQTSSNDIRSMGSRTTRRRVICSLHVATVIKQLTDESGNFHVSGVSTDADKAAREAVLAAHWDEYQSQLSANLERIKNEHLMKLPAELRVYIAEAENAS